MQLRVVFRQTTLKKTNFGLVTRHIFTININKRRWASQSLKLEETQSKQFPMVWCKNCRALLGFDSRFLCYISFLFFSKSTAAHRNHIYKMCLFLIYFGVSGTNCTCEKASINIEAKQGTDLRGNCRALSGGPSPQISNFSNMGEALPPPSLESFLLSDKPIGASPRRDYVAKRMVLVQIEYNLLQYLLYHGVGISKKGGNAPRATD